MNLRATILMLLSQVASLLSNYGIQVFLARELGVAGFGEFTVAFSMLMSIEFFVVAGIPNALQKFVAETPENAYSIHKKFFKWQLFYASLVTGLSFFAAPLFASSLSDDQIGNLFRVALLDVIPFAFFWYFAGFQIGFKRFEKFAITSITYSIFKFIFMFGLTKFGFGTQGALAGNACGSLMGMIVGIRYLKIEKNDSPQPLSSHTKEFIISNIIYAWAFNLLYYIDVWFVKRFCEADVVGHYSAASTLSKIPYLFSIALTGMILPSLSSAVKNSDQTEIKNVIQQAFRMAFLAFVPVVVFIEIWPTQITTLVFSKGYVQGAVYVQILFPALTFLALLSITNTMLMADKGMKICGALVLGLAVLSAGLNSVLVPMYFAKGAALATGITLLIGFLVSISLVWKQYKILFEFKTLSRALVAGIAIWLIGSFWHPENLAFLAFGGIVLVMIYAIVLLVLGEVTIGDLKQAKEKLMSRFA